MTQYSIRPKQSVIHAQAVNFLHSAMPSATCLLLGDVRIRKNKIVIFCKPTEQLPLIQQLLVSFIQKALCAGVSRNKNSPWTNLF